MGNKLKFCLLLQLVVVSYCCLLSHGARSLGTKVSEHKLEAFPDNTVVRKFSTGSGGRGFSGGSGLRGRGGSSGSGRSGGSTGKGGRRGRSSGRGLPFIGTGAGHPRHNSAAMRNFRYSLAVTLAATILSASTLAFM